jgi:Flp pilus assembly protein TadG
MHPTNNYPMVRHRSNERGSVTIMTAILLFGLVLALGLVIDVARIYMVRASLQNAADAAALAGARELNSSPGGLTDAVTQAGAIVNQYGFNRTGLTAPQASILTVEFAANIDGPWFVVGGVAPGTENTIKFIRVTTATANVSILFAARALGSNHVEQRSAVAGMSVGLNRICNFFPIALALSATNQAALTAGTLVQLTGAYTDNITGSSAAVPDLHYAVIQIPNITGTGQVETIDLSAGIPNLCASIGEQKTLDSSQSANSNNGRDSIARGANTRFDIFTNGPGQLSPTVYPPDTNISQGITAAQYLAHSPTTAPSHTGQDDRRILVMPIILPLPPGSSPTIQITKFGAFLLRNQVAPGSNCGPNTWCGADLQLEYLGDAFAIGRGYFDPNVSSSSLTKPVLYR